MKILLSFILFFSLTGCSFLQVASESEDFEESAYSEEENGAADSEGEMTEDEEDISEENGDEWDEEDTAEEEEVGEADDDEADGKEKGFFARLFSWDDDDEEEEEDMEDEGEEGSETEDMGMDEEDSAGEDFDEGDFDEEAFQDDGFEEDSGEGVVLEDSPVDSGKAPSVSAEKPAAMPAPPVASDSVVEKKVIPLNKARTKAYRKGSYLVNGIYIARPGDTIESISRKLSNEGGAEALHAINGHLRSRDVKVGDKVYYNSPLRGRDSESILTYYEDTGISASTYLIQPGENIRSVSKKLLGHPASWKEIWATNPGLISKGLISEASEIRYWPVEPEPSAPEEASAEPAEEASVPSEEPLEADDDETFSEDEADEDESPGGTDLESDEVAENKKKRLLAKDALMIIGACVLILLSLVALIVKRRRKNKEFDYTAV